MIDTLLQTIHTLRQQLVNGAGDDVRADLYGFRMQLLKQRERAVRAQGVSKVCARCDVPYPQSDYQGKRGRICHTCRMAHVRARERAYSSAYYAAHTEEQRAKMRANYAQKKPEYRARRSKWVAEHRDRDLELKRAWNKRNRQKRNAERRKQRAGGAG